jgi:hypothetical protein
MGQIRNIFGKAASLYKSKAQPRLSLPKPTVVEISGCHIEDLPDSGDESEQSIDETSVPDVA